MVNLYNLNVFSKVSDILNEAGSFLTVQKINQKYDIEINVLMCNGTKCAFAKSRCEQ